MPNTFTKVFPFYYLLTAVYSNFYYSSFFSSLFSAISVNNRGKAANADLAQKD